MFVRHLLLATALAATASTAANAQNGKISQVTSGYSYYNRQGADWQVHDADLQECAAIASNMNAEEYQRNSSGKLGVVGGVIEGWIAGSAQRGIFSSAIENCMVVKGWRVVSLEDSIGKQLEVLPPRELREKLSNQIGVSNPMGRVVRWWNNDAARASSSRFALRPPANGKQLSLRALTGGESANSTSSVAPVLLSIVRHSWKDMTRTVPDKDWDSIRADRALIVIKMKGVGPKNGVTLSFARVDDEPNNLKPSFTAFQHGLSGNRREGRFYVFEVDPGLWRLATIHALNLCLGAPAFEVKAGDVVYGGSFDLASEAIGPDLTLAEPTAFLAGHAISQRLRPAEYRNGVVTPCLGTGSIYALEVAGAPFDPNYIWGSRAGGTGSP